MSRHTISAISVVPLLLGSSSLLAAGFGLISSRYLFAGGLVCLAIFGLIEILSGMQHR
jgi:hypothetical protein